VIASVAVLLAFFAIFRVDLAGSPVISFRFHDRWQSQEVLVLSGSVDPPIPMPAPSPNLLASLSSYYATLANNGEVRKLILRDGPLHGSYRVVADTNGAQRVPLPILTIEGTARTKAIASSIATRVSRGFRAYVLQKQEEAQIPVSNRVQLHVVSPAAANVKHVQSGHRLLWPLVARSVVLVALALALGDARRRDPQR